MSDPTAFLGTLSQIGRLLRTYCDQRFRALDLTLARGRVMLHLGRAGSPLSQSALTALLDVEHPTTVRLLDGLEQSGLVERRSVPGDRRSKDIALTEAGVPVAARVTTAIDGIALAVIDGIDPAELAVADRVLTEILANLARLSREAGARPGEAAE